jgi:hypothetical protein
MQEKYPENDEHRTDSKNWKGNWDTQS